jgi:hypothetical protein
MNQLEKLSAGTGDMNSPIIDRVPLNQLASFLLITPETLSRIRARIRSEGDQATRSDAPA